MKKLNLVIADSDKEYLDALFEYIKEHCWQTFQINTFTNEGYLNSYLNEQSDKVDILLITQPIYQKLTIECEINAIIFLADNDLGGVNKYQPGDSIIAQVLDIYYQNSPDALGQRDQKTRVIGVYSPIGGCGKTTISIAASQASVEKGKNVLYLNFEEIASTNLFFEYSSHQSLSRIFYFIKDRAANLTPKLEKFKMIDQWTGIHYFSPPQSGLEFDEIACDDIEYFFKQIKSTSTYDLVFVDMSSGFSDKNRMLLEMLDDIFFIVTPSSVSDMKARQIFKEFEFLERQKNSTINKKIKILLNDVNEGSACNLNTCERPIFMKIPKAETLFEQRENRLAIDLKGDFADSIKQLVTKVLEGEKNGQS